MPFASAEFISLCRSQLLVLSQALRATSTVIYLAQPTGDSDTLSLVPLLAYPETEEGLLPGVLGMVQPSHDPSSPEDFAGESEDLFSEDPSSSPSPWAGGASPLVLPLIHEGVALGVIVSHRLNLPWGYDDQQQGEAIANTLALAWVLDQRGQWWQQQLYQQHRQQLNQSESFHDLLHQFRNPLTALQTFGKLLVKRLPSDDPNQTLATGIVRESQRLEGLAEQFDHTLEQGDEQLAGPGGVPPLGQLVLPGATGPTAGAEDPPFHQALALRPDHIAAVAAPLLPSIEAIAQDRGLHLWADLPEDLPPVWMDRAALGEVLSNLLDNALKYAPAGALVWVRGGLAEEWQGQAFQGIAVGDTGPGIPLADQSRVFDRHYRGVQSQGTIAGTGLGLAIGQELVNAMGGHLTLVSPAPLGQWWPTPPPETSQGFAKGPGTVFVVWLPVASDARPG
jgi:signal transduction histidine kinase